MVFADDQSHLRKGHGAHNMAVVRHFAINIVRTASDAPRSPLKRGLNRAVPYQVSAKLKTDLRKAAVRTLTKLKAVIHSALDSLTPKACRNCLAAPGYDVFDPT